MKKKAKVPMLIIILIIMYAVLHITPHAALRTYLFMSGHPISSLTSGIVDDELHNKIDKGILERHDAKCYTLTKPAFESATQSNLRNFKVTKKRFLYYAEYYGEA